MWELGGGEASDEATADGATPVKLDEVGKQGAIFDAEDLNADAFLNKRVALAELNKPTTMGPAFVFIKPTVANKVKDLAMVGLRRAGLKVVMRARSKQR